MKKSQQRESRAEVWCWDCSVLISACGSSKEGSEQDSVGSQCLSPSDVWRLLHYYSVQTKVLLFSSLLVLLLMDNWSWMYIANYNTVFWRVSPALLCFLESVWSSYFSCFLPAVCSSPNPASRAAPGLLWSPKSGRSGKVNNCMNQAEEKGDSPCRLLTWNRYWKQSW